MIFLREVTITQGYCIWTSHGVNGTYMEYPRLILGRLISCRLSCISQHPQSSHASSGLCAVWEIDSETEPSPCIFIAMDLPSFHILNNWKIICRYRVRIVGETWISLLVWRSLAEKCWFILLRSYVRLISREIGDKTHGCRPLSFWNQYQTYDNRLPKFKWQCLFPVHVVFYCGHIVTQ